jgi:hypothetical protein
MGEMQRVAVPRPSQSHALVPAAREKQTARPARVDHQEPPAATLRYMMAAGSLQPRLAVGPVDDPFEREAERTADAVMAPDSAIGSRGTEPWRNGLAASVTRMVRRAIGKLEPMSRKDDEQKKDDEKKKVVQKSSAGAGPSVVPLGVEHTIEMLSAGGGTPLSSSLRARFEPRFGYDFGAVRVHTNDRATGAATALGARAFTVGDHLFFGAGEYQPTSTQGQRLIAHELTHVVQQGVDPQRVRRRPIISWQVGGTTFYKSSSGEIVELPDDMTVEQVAKLEDEALAAERRLAELPRPKPVPEVRKPAPKPKKLPPPKAKPRAKRRASMRAPKLADVTAAMMKAVGGGKVAQYLVAKGAPVFAHGAAKLSTLKAHEQTHEDAGEKLKHSEDAVVIPASEEQSTGNAVQVSDVGLRQAPVVDESKGKSALDQSLAANVPKSIGVLDNFERDKKAQHTAAEVLDVVQGDKNVTVATFGDVRLTPPPVPSGHEPVQLPPPEGAPATPAMHLGRGAIAPLLKEHTDVSDYTKKADAKLNEEGVTQEQLDMVDSGDLAEANKEKKGMTKMAATEPLAVQKMANDERTRVDSELAHEEHAERNALAGRRKTTLAVTGVKQKDTRTALEKKRDAVAKDINDRYKLVQDKVTKRLADLDGESMKRFDDGNTAAATEFEANVKRELEAYKDDRYSGWFGWARKAKDWLLGMDDLPKVKAIFTRNRDAFQKRIKTLVDDIAADNARVIRECHEELTTSKQKIDEYVAGLDPSLQDIGKKAAAEMNEKLAELDKTISKKEEELRNKLKDKQTAAIKAIDEKIEKMKEAMSGALAKVGRLLLMAAKKFFTWALEKFGLSLSTIESIIDKGIAVLKAIFTHPIQFVKNLIGAAKTGFGNFAKNFVTHLKDAVFEWLTGSLEGISLPESWTVRGIASVLFQLVGISWVHLKAALVRLIPAPVVEGLQTTFGLVKTLVVEGPMAAWEQIKDMGEELKQSFVAALTDWLKWKVVEEAVKTIVAMFVPGAGIVRAIIAIYDTIVFFIQKAKDIMQMIGNFLGSIAEIAAGNIAAAAEALENGLARGLKLVIAFLAKFLRLDGITARIRAVLAAIRTKVDAVLDRVAGWVVGMAKKAGKLVGIGGAKADEKTPPETVSKHHELLKKLVPRIEEDEPGPALTDVAWLEGKRKRAQQLEQESQPKLEPGVKISISLKAGALPRQLEYDMKIAPNTTTASGATTPPVLTVGELYTFYVNFAGKSSPITAKFVEATMLQGQWAIKAAPPGERETERSDTGNELRGKWKGLIIVPAIQPDGSPNYRLANAASPEAPVFRLTNSRRTARGGFQPIDVEAEPLALTAKYASPYQEPPGLARIAAPLKTSGAWVPGHLVNGEMGGPGSNENLVPIDRNTNAKMRGGYENALRQNLRLGKYYFFHAHVDYHSGTVNAVGRADDFTQIISIDFEEITKKGSAWVRSGIKGSAGPYTVSPPTVAELDPARVGG